MQVKHGVYAEPIHQRKCSRNRPHRVYRGRSTLAADDDADMEDLKLRLKVAQNKLGKVFLRSH